MRHLSVCVATVVVALTGTCALACGPDFPTPFLSGGDSAIGNSRLESELIILGNHFRPTLPNLKLPRKSPKVATADLAEFTAFLDELKPELSDDRKKLLAGDYRDYAKGCRLGEKVYFPYKLEGADEFILYLEGVRKFNLAQNAGGLSRMPAEWTAILKLPEKKRRYRTTWVLYMAGNMASDPAMANARYVELRKAVDDGFKDSLALAHHSFRVAVLCGDPVWKLKNAFEGYCYYRGAKDVERATFCLNWVRSLLSRNAFNHTRAKLWGEDEVCRELMTMFLTSSGAIGFDTPAYMGSEYDKMLPFDILNVLKGKTVKSAGHAAWFFYEQGRLKDAAAFAEMTTKSDLLGLWTKGRLAKRRGDVKVAAAILSEWLAVYAVKAKEKYAEATNYRLAFPESNGFHNQVRGELGLVNVEQGDFLEAIHCFILGELWIDAASIADRIVDLKKLTEYVDAHDRAKSPITKKNECWSKLRWLLARRLFRNGDVKKALNYYPETVIPHAKAYMELMKKSVAAKGADDRALALYNAAKILRWQGMELAGTEVYPDFTVYRGHYEWSGQDLDWPKRFADTNVPALHKKSIVSPNKRFHYRYRAAERMWRVADDAETVELKALACYVGGRYLELHDPKAADRFYKRLVNLKAFPLSRKADVLRWFPKNYSDGLTAEFKSIAPITMDDVRNILLTIQVLHTIAYNGGRIRGLGFVKDSKSFIALSNGGDLMTIDAMTGKTTCTTVVPPKYRDCLAISPTHERCAVAGKAGVVHILDLKTGKVALTITISTRAIKTMAWSPDGRLLAVADADGLIDLRNSVDGSCLGRLKVKGVPRVVCFSPKGEVLACAGNNRTVEIWNFKNRKLVRTLRGHVFSIRTLAFSADGVHLLSGSDDLSVRIWDAGSGRQIHEIIGHDSLVTSVLADDKGRKFMTTSLDGKIATWTMATGKLVTKKPLSETGIVMGATSPDRKWVVTADRDGTIRIICNPFAK